VEIVVKCEGGLVHTQNTETLVSERAGNDIATVASSQFFLIGPGGFHNVARNLL
jgi:hypothetical protein